MTKMIVSGPKMSTLPFSHDRYSCSEPVFGFDIYVYFWFVAREVERRWQFEPEANFRTGGGGKMVFVWAPKRWCVCVFLLEKKGCVQLQDGQDDTFECWKHDGGHYPGDDSWVWWDIWRECHNHQPTLTLRRDHSCPSPLVPFSRTVLSPRIFATIFRIFFLETLCIWFHSFHFPYHFIIILFYFFLRTAWIN